MGPKRGIYDGGTCWILLAAGVFGLTGCDKKSEGLTAEAAEVKSAAATWCQISLVDNPTQPPHLTIPVLDRLPLSRARLTSPFVIVVKVGPLAPFWKGEMSCSFKDPAGKSVVPFDGNPIPFQAEGTGTNGWVTLPIKPDAPKYSAGTWELTVNVPTLGTSSHSFVIDPPTAAEQAALADHEEAKRHALKAFSSFWVVFPHKDLKNTYITATKPEKTGSDVQSQFNLCQVARLKYTCTQSRLSDADRLNGISYRGEVGFGFSLYRSYSPEKKWEEWKDLNSARNVVEAGINKVFEEDYADPERSQQAPCMRFSVQKRDGNWIVTSKERARFINGVRSDDPEVAAEKKKIRDEEQDKKLAEIRKGLLAEEVRRERRMNSYGTVVDYSTESEIPESPASYFNRTLSEAGTEGTLFSGDTFQPSLAIVEQIVDETATKRADLKNTASELSLTPETSKQQQEATIAALGE